MGNVEGSPFGFDSYVQIRTCVTYRRRSQLLATFSDESRVAPHVVGMLLTVAALVVGARTVLFLLQRVSTARVFRVLRPPLLIESPLLFSATVRTATGPLPLFGRRKEMTPTTRDSTLPSGEHM